MAVGARPLNCPLPMAISMEYIYHRCLEYPTTIPGAVTGSIGRGIIRGNPATALSPNRKGGRNKITTTSPILTIDPTYLLGGNLKQYQAQLAFFKALIALRLVVSILPPALFRPLAPAVGLILKSNFENFSIYRI